MSRADAAVALGRRAPAGRLEPVEARHPDVHQDDVGSVPPGEPDGRLAVGGLGDDVDIRLGLEDHPEAGPDQRLVVGDEDPESAARSRRSGPVTARRPRRRSGSQARTA